MEALTAIDIDLASHKTAQSHPLKLAEAIQNMILKPKEIRKVGLAGRKMISDHNDYKTEMAKVDKLYKLLV